MSKNKKVEDCPSMQGGVFCQLNCGCITKVGQRAQLASLPAPSRC
jgi:hypothetical protein